LKEQLKIKTPRNLVWSMMNYNQSGSSKIKRSNSTF
jgi:hypothetical protein